LNLLSARQLENHFSVAVTGCNGELADKEKSMKHFGLAPITFFTLTLTGLLLPYSGWFAAGSSARPPARTESRSPARDRDETTEAALRFRSGQPAHWRAFMLHH
jgi:hypothetical protein